MGFCDPVKMEDKFIGGEKLKVIRKNLHGNLNCNNYNRSRARERNSKPGAKIGNEGNDRLHTNVTFYCPHLNQILFFLPFLYFYFGKLIYFYVFHWHIINFIFIENKFIFLVNYFINVTKL